MYGFRLYVKKCIYQVAKLDKNINVDIRRTVFAFIHCLKLLILLF
jgi:hypothetical protein